MTVVNELSIEESVEEQVKPSIEEEKPTSPINKE